MAHFQRIGFDDIDDLLNKGNMFHLESMLEADLGSDSVRVLSWAAATGLVLWLPAFLLRNISIVKSSLNKAHQNHKLSEGSHTTL